MHLIKTQLAANGYSPDRRLDSEFYLDSVDNGRRGIDILAADQSRAFAYVPFLYLCCL